MNLYSKSIHQHAYVLCLLCIPLNLSFGQNASIPIPLIPQDGQKQVQDAGVDPNERVQVTYTWSSVKGAQEYEVWMLGIGCGPHSGNHSGGGPEWTWPTGHLGVLPKIYSHSDTTATSGSDDICGPTYSQDYWWKVRAVIDDSAHAWSDYSHFTSTDIRTPNDKDQQLLDLVGWMKPTVWDSTKFHYTADIDTNMLNLHKELYKAHGNLVGHFNYHVYIFGPDETLWGPVLDINNENCEAAGHWCDGQPHYMGIARGNSIFEDGPYPNLGIGHGWSTMSPQELFESKKPLADGEAAIADVHEFTHVFEGTRMMSGGSKYGLWYAHMTSDGGFRFPFLRDYAIDIQSKYVDGITFGALDSLGNYYETTSWGVDTERRAFYGIISGEYDGPLSPGKRDSLIVAGNLTYGGMLAGYYLAYLTSNQQVYIDKYDDRAWTKPFEQAFEDAYGMTQLEFSQAFYDWYTTVDPLKWTYILPTEHSTELFHYPKRFVTSLPADGAEAIGRKPDFQWVASTDFSSYQIQVSLTQDFASPVYTMDVEGATSVYQDEVTTATLDSALEANTTYYWRMRSILGVNQSDWTEAKSFTTGTSVSTQEDALPLQFGLAQNYPNPFNPRTTIGFVLPQAQHVTLEVYNLLGQRVVTLVDRPMGAGQHSIGFHAADLASGMYLYRLTGAQSGVQTKTMYLIK